MLEQINEYLDKATEMLGKLNGLPGIVLVLLWCIAFGYALRGFKRFPNEAIPVAVILWGSIWNCLLAETAQIPMRIWLFRNVVVGGIIGLTAWAIHRFGISRFEGKIPFVRRVKEQDEAKLEHQTEIIAKKNAESHGE